MEQDQTQEELDDLAEIDNAYTLEELMEIARQARLDAA